MVEANGDTRILPGHGPVLVGDEQLERMKNYWRLILEQVSDARAAGSTLEALQASLGAADSALAELREQLVVDELSDCAAESTSPPDSVASFFAPVRRSKEKFDPKEPPPMDTMHQASANPGI